MYPGFLKINKSAPPQGKLGNKKNLKFSNGGASATTSCLSDDVDVTCLGISSLRLCKELRDVQKRTKCTENTVLDFLATFGKFLGCPLATIDLTGHDKFMQKVAGVSCLILNGCSGPCNQFVYLPSNKMTHCPNCGHPRYGADGQPNEV